MAFGRKIRHALHCRRSLPTLLQASEEKSRLTEQCSSRSIWRLHSTMWTINICSIVSSMPTYRQLSVAGSATICRKDEPKFICGKENLLEERVTTGVVQGVLSPSLFNYYLADLPTPAPIIKLIKHADDITIYTSGPVVSDLINGLNMYLSQVLDYINKKKQKVSMAKSTVARFTPDIDVHHIHPQVKLADQVLPLEKKPKVLRVTVVTLFTFTQHNNNIAVKVQQRNNVFNEISSSSWGCDK